jgi:hypothetical protein
MRIPYSGPGRVESEAELHVIGNALGLEVDGKLHRIGPLTPSQWHLLADSASDRAENPAGAHFVHVGPAVMQGNQHAARAISKTMAKRIANALNRHKTNREGV